MRLVPSGRPARMACEPAVDFRRLVGGAIVGNGVNELVGQDIMLQRIDEAD